MPVTRLDHLVLTVADLERSVAWYRDVAGMGHVTFGEGRHALTFGEQKINLHVQGHEIEPHARAPTPGSGDLCFIVDESPIELGRRLDCAGRRGRARPGARATARGARSRRTTCAIPTAT